MAWFLCSSRGLNVRRSVVQVLGIIHVDTIFICTHLLLPQSEMIFENGYSFVCDIIYLLQLSYFIHRTFRSNCGVTELDLI